MKPRAPNKPKDYRFIKAGETCCNYDAFPLGGDWCYIWANIGKPYTKAMIAKSGPYIRKVTRK